MRYLLFLFACSIPSIIFSQSAQYYLQVGTYTTGKSEGIYCFQFNAVNGTAKLKNIAKTDNPSFLHISSNQQFLYAVKEDGKDSISAARSYTFNKNTGQLGFMNQQLSKSIGGCYIRADKKNNWLFTANYRGGTLSVFPLKTDGSIDSLRQLIVHRGSSIHKSRQQEAHVHTVVFSPNEKYLICTDLGTDKITLYPFTSSAVYPLDTVHCIHIVSKPGNGPRHLAFSPNEKYLYVINELSGTIDVFNFNNGNPTLLQTISTDSTHNTDKGSADIHLSEDGRFLYCTNRGNYNTISTFSVDMHSGHLQLLQVLPSGGITPRNFCIDPSNNYLLVAHQKSDNIAVFKRNQQTGLLTNTGNDIKVGSPVCLLMGKID